MDQGGQEWKLMQKKKLTLLAKLFEMSFTHH